MSIESRLERGDNYKDVAKLFKIPEQDAKELQKELTGKTNPPERQKKTKV